MKDDRGDRPAGVPSDQRIPRVFSIGCANDQILAQLGG
jgi:hypothetical protein